MNTAVVRKRWWQPSSGWGMRSIFQKRQRKRWSGWPSTWTTRNDAWPAGEGGRTGGRRSHGNRWFGGAFNKESLKRTKRKTHIYTSTFELGLTVLAHPSIFVSTKTRTKTYVRAYRNITTRKHTRIFQRRPPPTTDFGQSYCCRMVISRSLFQTRKSLPIPL